MRKIPLAALAGINLFLGLALNPPAVLAASFSDVPQSDPNYTAIESLKELDIIKGYGDGNIRPLQPVNRAEALKPVLFRAQRALRHGFSDVGIGEWFSGYVMYGVMKGIVSGNPDGTFAPARTVNRAEYLKMLLKAYGADLEPFRNPATPVSADSSTSDWYTPYFGYAKSIGIISPDLFNNLSPRKNQPQRALEILYKMYIHKTAPEPENANFMNPN